MIDQGGGKRRGLDIADLLRTRAHVTPSVTPCLLSSTKPLIFMKVFVATP